MDKAASHALTESFIIPPKIQGHLADLKFVAKDTIDIEGYISSNGHPAWKKTHYPAIRNALCIEQLLCAGATCVGHAASVELTFSIDGENPFYGTPVNPKAPNRVPGGSSSGSTAAVAIGFADFALGTDNTGSIRVPASHCGVWGMRPSPQAISVAGVIPFAPSFDNVGLLASDAKVLARIMEEFLQQPLPKKPKVNRIYLVKEAFALCDDEIVKSLSPAIEKLKEIFPKKVVEISLSDVIADPQATSLIAWYTEIIKNIQWIEIINSIGSWLESVKPVLSPRIQENVDRALQADPAQLAPSFKKLHLYRDSLDEFLMPADLLCIPTTPTIAPLLNQLENKRFMDDYFLRTFGLNAIAVIGGLPQISIPVATARGAPVGLSLLARNDSDPFLLSVILHSLESFSKVQH